MFKPLKSTIHCSYRGCKSLNLHGIRMFRMPRNPLKQGPWRNFVKSSGRESADTATIFRLCEFHFDVEDIEINDDNIKVLKMGAIPKYEDRRKPEVMKKCGVPGCGNDTKKGFTLFKFPPRKELRDQWAQFLIMNGVTDYDENKFYMVCDEHFEEQMITSEGRPKTITWDAVPSINKNPIVTTLLPSISSNSKPSTSTKPVRKCAIKTCKFNSKELFISPKDSTKLMKWKEAADTNESEFYVCVAHFVKNDMVIETSIKYDAIPKLHLSDECLNASTFEKDKCGICFEFKHSVFEITDEQYTSFIDISGLTPLSRQICKSCKDSLDKFKEFKTSIPTKHLEYRAKVKKSAPKSTTNAIKVMINGVEKTLTILKPITSTVKVKEEPQEEPMVVDSEKFKCSSCSFVCNTKEELNSHNLKPHVPKKVFPTNQTRILNRIFSCPKCPRKFDSETILAIHLREVHHLISSSYSVKKVAHNNPLNTSRPMPIKPSSTNSLKIDSIFALSPQTNTSLSFKRIEDIMVNNIKSNFSKRKEIVKVPENPNYTGQDGTMEVFEINEIEDNGQFGNVQNLEEVNLMQEPTKVELMDENEDGAVKISDISENIADEEMVQEINPSTIIPYKNLTLIKHRQISSTVAPKVIPGNPSKLKCLTCGRTFPSISTLVTHRIVEHRNKPKKKVIQEQSAEEDMESDDNTLEYKCDSCERTFDSKDLLQKHVDADHNDTEDGEVIPQCPICLKKFFNKGNELDKHMEAFHKDGYDCGARCNPVNNAYQCNKCNGTYFSLTAMRVHSCT